MWQLCVLSANALLFPWQRAWSSPQTSHLLLINGWVISPPVSGCVRSCIFQRLSFSFYIVPLLIYVHLNAAEISLLQLLSGLSDRRLDFDACNQLCSCYVMYWALLCTCRFPRQQISELYVEYACVHYCPQLMLLYKGSFRTAATGIEDQWSHHWYHVQYGPTLQMSVDVLTEGSVSKFG